MCKTNKTKKNVKILKSNCFRICSFIVLIVWKTTGVTQIEWSQSTVFTSDVVEYKYKMEILIKYSIEFHSVSPPHPTKVRADQPTAGGVLLLTLPTHAHY